MGGRGLEGVMMSTMVLYEVWCPSLSIPIIPGNCTVMSDPHRVPHFLLVALQTLHRPAGTGSTPSLTRHKSYLTVVALTPKHGNASGLNCLWIVLHQSSPPRSRATHAAAFVQYVRSCRQSHLEARVAPYLRRDVMGPWWAASVGKGRGG